MLRWNVFVEDINRRQIKSYDIFNHGGFYGDLYKCTQTYKKTLKNAVKPKEREAALVTYRESIRKELMYYFWAKAEWEVVITDWPVHLSTEELDRAAADREEYVSKWKKEPGVVWVTPQVEEKVDVYSQIMLNFDAFIEYILAHIKEIKRPANG